MSDDAIRRAHEKPATPGSILPGGIVLIDELAEARRVVSAVDLRHPHPHDEAWRQEQLRLLAIEQKLAVAGITLGELIDLIDARREGLY